MSKIDWDRHNRARAEWPNNGFDWTGAATVPENPSKTSGWIVSLATAFTFAALAGSVLYTNYTGQTKDLLEFTDKVASITGLNFTAK